MSVGTLWTVPQQPQGNTYIRAAAAFGDLSIDVPENYKHFEDNKKPEFLSKFPMERSLLSRARMVSCCRSRMPSDATSIFFTVASLAPNSTLLGTSAHEAARVDQWSFFAVTEIFQHNLLINHLVKGIITPYNKPVRSLLLLVYLIHQTLAERQLRSLKTLNEHLASRTFLVSERITLADLVTASILQFALTSTFDAPLRSQLSHVVRFFETVVNQPKLKDIYGETTYVEKALQYVPPPKEKKEPKAAEKKVEKKPKKVEDDEEEEEDKPIEEPKAKNPLDSLPKSSFNLEDWKRAYSNMDTRGAGGAIEWFYDKFDKEGFSIWRVDYKYPEELTLTFMSSNLITGFFNRLEASRKYLFGSLGVIGTNNNSVISGVFILRGPDFKPVVDVAPDWESYSYKKIDLENADDKAFFESALAWDLKSDDKEWVDGKNYCSGDLRQIELFCYGVHAIYIFPLVVHLTEHKLVVWIPFLQDRNVTRGRQFGGGQVVHLTAVL
ncbi:elongation factor 1-gamma [Phellopilus nigrolimitatus]|nr:elongation factor 1-gamma [Phellopilus nigrolimitatus]